MRRACLFAATLGLIVSVADSADAQLKATLIVNGLAKPLGFVPHPTDPAVQIILEQAGVARVLRNSRLEAQPLLDLRGQTSGTGEQGLLGLAFAPDFATSGRVYVNFTNNAGHTVVARFVRSSADPLRLDPASRFDLQWPDGQRFITQPFSNHNGGNLVFGPDGYLYIGLGDGGSANDPAHRAQQPGTLLGKMLRIDVNVPASNTRGYVIPPDNPFVGRAGVLQEIWAFGLRNPWRYSFDDVRMGGTGALVIGDVGQDSWEEVDYEPRGAGGRNYGWRNREGAHTNITNPPPFSPLLTEPILEYSPGSGRSVIGGIVYRGRALGAPYAGRYFFGDYVSGRIWSVGLTVDPATGEGRATGTTDHSIELGDASNMPSSFGVDASGEVYVVSYGGAVYRIDSGGPAGPGGPSGGAPRPPGSTDTRKRTGPAIGQAQGR